VDNYLIKDINALAYIPYAFLSFCLGSLLFAHRTIINETKKLKPKNIKIMLLGAVGFYSFNLLTFLAYENDGDVGSIDALNNASIFLILFSEYYLLKEKENVSRKLVAGIIAVFGMLILSQS